MAGQVTLEESSFRVSAFHVLEWKIGNSVLRSWSLLALVDKPQHPLRLISNVVVDDWRSVDHLRFWALLTQRHQVFFHHPWAEKISRGNSCGPLPASRVPVGRYVLERKSDPEPCAGD